jgi:hypothetical protein
MKVVQAEIKAAYAEMEARAVTRHERFLASLDGLTSYGEGTTTYQTETTSCPGEMKDAIKMEATRLVDRGNTGRSGVSGAPNGRSRRGRCRVIGGPVWRTTLGCATSSRGKEADPRQCWVRQQLSAARKQVIRRAVPAVPKGHMRKSLGKGRTARGAPKGRRLQKTQRISSGCKTGIRAVSQRRNYTYGQSGHPAGQSGRP